MNGHGVDETPTTKKFILVRLTNMARKYNGLCVDDMNEGTFVKSRVDPIMAAFFKNEDEIIIDGCSTTLASSETSRKRFDPSLRGKMVEITVSLKEENGITNLIIMEVKPPAKTKDDVDLLKTTNMMKNSMDCMHHKRLTSTGMCVMGIFVENYRHDLYVMDLDKTFFHRLIKLGAFHIPVHRYDFGRLPGLIEHMLTLRKCFDDMVHKYQDDMITQLRMSTPPYIIKKQKALLSLPTDYFRYSFINIIICLYACNKKYLSLVFFMSLCKLMTFLVDSRLACVRWVGLCNAFDE
ncbi:hypothetical protein BC941DRAFT_472346 [Chlamydoabsidia padenii]|nr:hypothetical protein BC941DRAFT_472346 [Chlamydoabsidia padenii]